MSETNGYDMTPALAEPHPELYSFEAAENGEYPALCNDGSCKPVKRRPRNGRPNRRPGYKTHSPAHSQKPKHKRSVSNSRKGKDNGRASMPAARITEIDAEFFGQEGAEMMQQAAANGIAEAFAGEPEAEA